MADERDRFERLSDLFERARALDPAGRDRLLDETCADDPGLRREVEELLRRHDATSPLDDAAAAAARIDAVAIASADRLPERIGPYRILGRLGAGGMGEVLEAEQDDPRRRVALKLVRAGWSSGDLLARFDAERRTLARMNHPGIATVFDAGVSEDGRPYVAMELVDGPPLPAYCDEHRCTTRRRLELLLGVCDAVEHAHRNGVIHRDLKPSNVLVVERDGVATPKVIDFGIAKVIGGDAEDAPLLTRTGQIVGTPAYMAPEQAGSDDAGVDTRADVYAIGVMLYELLTGSTPHARRGDEDGNDLAESIRRLREDEPERPSTRLSRLAERATIVASSQRTDVHRLCRTLRGELDWVVMKCLEKDRDRRYGSVGELADDLRRFLANEPVLATPPSAAYRARKFVRRHRVPVVAAALVATTLVTGIVGTTWAMLEAFASRAESERNVDRLQRVSDFQSERIGAVDAVGMGDRLRASIVQAAPEASRDALRAELDGINFTNIALESLDADLLSPTVDSIDAAFPDEPLVRAQLLQATVDTMDRLGIYESAVEPSRRALAIRREELGESHPDTIQSLTNASVLVANLARYEEAQAFAQEALDAHRRANLEPDEQTYTLVRNLGVLLKLQGDPETAEPLYREALEGRTRLLGEEHEDTVASMHDLGVLLSSTRRYEEAEPHLLAALEARRRLFGPDDPKTIDTLASVAGLMGRTSQHEEALGYRTEIVAIRRRLLGDNHPDTLAAIGNQASTLLRLERATEALPLMDEAVTRARETLGPEHWYVGYFLSYRGLALTKLESWVEAERSLVEAWNLLSEGLGARHGQARSAARMLSELYAAWNEDQPDPARAAEAERWFEISS